MVPRPDVRLRAAVTACQDLFPKAFWAGDGDPDPHLDALVKGAHLRGPRWVCPSPGALDHWETVQAGEPWAYFEAAVDGLWLGLQAEGERAVARARALLTDADRIDRLVAATARIGPHSTTAAVAVRCPPHGRFEERVLLGRMVETDQVGPAVLEGILEGALATRGLASGEAPGVRFVRLALPEGDTVALRRVVRRVVRVWQAVWRVPQPKAAAAAKDELDKRLRGVYRGSLRNLVHADPRIRARLRVEARELARAYRESGRARPRLLDLVQDRLGILE